MIDRLKIRKNYDFYMWGNSKTPHDNKKCKNSTKTQNPHILEQYIFHKTVWNYSVQGQGKCGVAVIRVSGSEALRAFQKMTKVKIPEPRKAHLSKIIDPETKEVIDKGLCLWFPGKLTKTKPFSKELLKND